MSWHQNIVNVIRSVIFQDDTLKDMMLIPVDQRSNIVKFRDNYFVNDVLSDTLMNNEDVRITYYTPEPMETDSPNVMKYRIYFDIYVKRSHSYDYGVDRMLHRGDLIAERLIKLLGGKTLCNIRFFSRGSYDQLSKREGYDRKTVVFMYRKVFK